MLLAVKSNLNLERLKKCKFYKDFMIYKGNIKKIKWHYFEMPTEFFSISIEYSLLNDTDIVEYGLDFQGLRPNATEYIPDNENFGNQWGFRNIGQYGGFPGIDSKITYAWDVEQGDFEIITAIVDDGVDIDHECLVGHAFFDPSETVVIGEDADNNGFVNDFVGWDMESNDYAAYKSGHGTALASLITTNGNGMSGVTFRSRIMPVHIGSIGEYDIPEVGIEYPCDRAKYKQETYSSYYVSIPTSRVASAIIYAADKGAHIILVAYSRRETQVISCCSTYPIATPMPDVRDAIRYAGRQGCIVVASAGDWLPEGCSFPCAAEGVHTYSEFCESDEEAVVREGDRNIYPGAYTRFFDFMINVTAHDNWGYLYYEKNEISTGVFTEGFIKGTAFGTENIDLAAPGKDIIVAKPGDSYALAGGSSVAAAFVAGAAALVWSRNAYLRNSDVVNIIKGTVEKTTYWGERVGTGGMLNVQSAINAAK